MLKLENHGARTRNRFFALVVAGVVGAVLLTAANAVAAPVYRYVRGGAVTSVRAAVTSGDEVLVDSTTDIAIGGSEVSVTVPSGKKRILLINFSAEERCGNAD